MAAIGSPAGTTEVTVWLTRLAGAKLVLPSWLASITQVPAGALKVTRPDAWLSVHPDVDEGSTLKLTGLPEPPPVALIVYVAPIVGLAGGVLVKVMTWGAGLRDATFC